MKMQISLSMPQLDYPQTVEEVEFQLDDLKLNAETTTLVVAKNTTWNLFGKTFYHVRSVDGTDSLILVENGLTILWSATKTEHIHGREMIVEKSAWSRQNNTLVKGLIRRIYLEHYLIMFKAICSSDTHRVLGKTMWIKLCDEAFTKHYCVYIVKHGSFTELLNLKNLLAREHTIWNDDESFKNVRLVITLSNVDKMSRLPQFSTVAYTI